MRDDVTEIMFEDMSPELRALITYEANGTLDLPAPQSAIDAIRRRTPVIRWEFGLGFFGMDDIVAAGRNPDLVSTNPATGVPFGMGSTDALIPLHIDGDAHRRYRKLLDPIFAPRKMALLETEIRKLAHELIESFVGDKSVELHEAFCVPLPSIIFLNLFGMPLEDMDFLIAMKDRILKNDGQTMEEMDAIGIAAGEELRVRLRVRLAERRADPGRHDDLLDQFIHFELDGQRLDDDEVVNIMHLFTIAGLDTVTSSLSCIFAHFATHPDDRRRVVEDPLVLPAAIEEILRVESPVPSGGPRWAVRDTEVNGVPVREGDLIYLCWASANLDPSAFTNPLVADFDREENRHIAFAAGIHRCLGSHLARIELRTAVDQLHQRIPEYRVRDGDQIRFTLGGVRQATHIPLSFDAE